MPDRKRLAQDWSARGSHDLLTATLAFQAGAPADTVAVLVQQACEKYLKGYLISKGWSLKKTHDLTELIDVAIDHDRSFADYLDMARKLTAYYLEDRYPPGPPAEHPREEIATLMEQANRLIAKIETAS